MKGTVRTGRTVRLGDGSIRRLKASGEYDDSTYWTLETTAQHLDARILKELRGVGSND
ncbi:MAG: hypothetical protein ACLQEQ_05645 [Nitrososphaerales archaeon]